MLRTAEVAPSRLSRVVRFARAACLTVLLVAAAAAAGVRAPAAPAAEAEETPATKTPQVAEAPRPVEAATNADGYDFSYVPGNLFYLLAIRPSEIAASPQLSSLAGLLDETIRPTFKVESLKQLTIILPQFETDAQGAIVPGTGSEYTLFRTDGRVDFRPLIEASYGPTKTEEYEGKQLIAWGHPAVEGTIQFYSPTNDLLISTPRPRLVSVIDDPGSAKAPVDAAQWLTKAKGPAFGVWNISALRKGFGDNLLRGPILQMLKPVFDLADHATISVRDGDPLLLTATFACRSPEDAIRVEQTLRAAIVVIKNLVASQRAHASSAHAGANSAQQAEMLPLLELADHLLYAAEVKVVDSNVGVTAALKDPARIINSVLPSLRAARQGSQRALSQNNLRNLALAAHNYNDMFNDGYPPAVVYGKSAFPHLNSSGDKKAHVPRSWRVELLPLLGQEELYKQYRLDQPWDSEANLKVLRQMPAVYRSPFDQPTSTNTSYFAVAGPGTVFDGEEGTPLAEIRDGLSNTLLWVEAKRDVPWTKPEDIAYAPDEAVPAFGGWMKEGEFAAAYCDGSVRILAGIAEPALRQLIERADGTAGLPPSSASNAVLSPATPSDK